MPGLNPESPQSVAWLINLPDMGICSSARSNIPTIDYFKINRLFGYSRYRGSLIPGNRYLNVKQVITFVAHSPDKFRNTIRIAGVTTNPPDFQIKEIGIPCQVR